MARRLAVLIAALMMIVSLPAAAEARKLTIAEAKALAAKKAEKVKHELAEDGAERAKVPGCWRKADHKVYCYFSIWGYDEALDFRWKCMMKLSVVLRSNGHYAVRNGEAVCG
jgi:hypothetical protein